MLPSSLRCLTAEGVDTLAVVAAAYCATTFASSTIRA